MEIWASWQQNKGKNNVPNLDIFPVERPHRIDGFLGRFGAENDAFDLEKILKTGQWNSDFLVAEQGPKWGPQLGLFSVERPHRIDGFLGRLGPKNYAFDLEKILEPGQWNSDFLVAEWGWKGSHKCGMLFFAWKKTEFELFLDRGRYNKAKNILVLILNPVHSAMILPSYSLSGLESADHLCLGSKQWVIEN